VRAFMNDDEIEFQADADARPVGCACHLEACENGSCSSR
jgi:hypothetical protein